MKRFRRLLTGVAALAATVLLGASAAQAAPTESGSGVAPSFSPSSAVVACDAETAAVTLSGNMRGERWIGHHSFVVNVSVEGDNGQQASDSTRIRSVGSAPYSFNFNLPEGEYTATVDLTGVGLVSGTLKTMKSWTVHLSVVSEDCTEIIPIPEAPVWVDECGVDNNGYWEGYEDTDQYTWTIHDNSELNGKVGIFVTANEGYAFEEGRVRWTQVQDNTRCDAVVPEVDTQPTVCTVIDGEQGFTNGSVVLGDGEGVKSAYVFDTVDGKLVNVTRGADSLPAGEYTVIVTAEDGHEFTDLPEGWEYSKGPAGKAKVVTTVVVEEGEVDCSPLIPLEPATPVDDAPEGDDDNGDDTENGTSDDESEKGDDIDTLPEGEQLPETGVSPAMLLLFGAGLTGSGLLVRRFAL